MKLSYIITIAPVIPVDYLVPLIVSLNLQTSSDFDVIFYNQTTRGAQEIFSSLPVQCNFDYQFFSIDQRNFFGTYPIWDLYGFHNFLLTNDLVNDYFMSLHMEEFLEPEYTAKALTVLEDTSLDILMGNLHRTPYRYNDVGQLCVATDSDQFQSVLHKMRIDKSPKWGLPPGLLSIGRRPRTIRNNIAKYKTLGWKRQLSPTQGGYTYLENYLFEDIFFMSKKFATEFEWYDMRVNLYFEDIHINSSLESALKEILDFPVYLNNAKAYHLEHDKFYYQIADDKFALSLLTYETENPILTSLKEAITFYRNGKYSSVRDAIRISRRNLASTGSADLNYKLHLQNIKAGRTKVTNQSKPPALPTG